MRDFREEYEKAPSQIFRIITNRLAEGIRPLMWHVGEKSWLPWLFQLKKLDGVRASFKERMDWSVAQLEKLQKSDEATLQHFQTTLHNYLIKLHQKNITDRAVATVATRSRVISLLLTFLLAHFALLHVIFHLVPLRLGKWVARKMGPHPHFHASILFGLLMVILPVFYIIYFSVAWAVAGTLWPAVLLMAGLPLVARPARVWLESWQQLRVSESLVRMRSEVMSLLDKMQH